MKKILKLLLFVLFYVIIAAFLTINSSLYDGFPIEYEHQNQPLPYDIYYQRSLPKLAGNFFFWLFVVRLVFYFGSIGFKKIRSSRKR